MRGYNWANVSYDDRAAKWCVRTPNGTERFFDDRALALQCARQLVRSPVRRDIIIVAAVFIWSAIVLTLLSVLA